MLSTIAIKNQQIVMMMTLYSKGKYNKIFQFDTITLIHKFLIIILVTINRLNHLWSSSIRRLNLRSSYSCYFSSYSVAQLPFLFLLDVSVGLISSISEILSTLPYNVQFLILFLKVFSRIFSFFKDDFLMVIIRSLFLTWFFYYCFLEEDMFV